MYDFTNLWIILIYFPQPRRGFSIETLEYANLCLAYLLVSFTHLSQFREVRKADENDPSAQSINFMPEDQFYFSRVFHKVMGMSPANYRKRRA